MPTIAQMNLIVKGLTGGTDDLQSGGLSASNDTYKEENMNKYLETAAGGEKVKADYWTSVEYNTSNAWFMFFFYGEAACVNKNISYNVRAVLAF